MTYSESLKAYLSREGNTETLLAERVGVSQPAINRYRKGERFPDAEIARLIDRATGGEVPFAVWQADFMTRSGLAA